jgi:glycosyltransferase involved in cell wall biosynthesis
LLAHGMRLLVALAARQSRRILTLSEAAKEDIVRFLRVPADRVDVTYLGPGLPDDVTPTPEGELRGRLRLDDEPIVLTVSAKRPHKNLERLISAVGTLEAPARLIVPGYATPFEDDLRAHAERVAPGRVVFTGWVEAETLEGLYRAATCFAFPSLAEGFGLPVLEAGLARAPLVCPDLEILREVGGGGPLRFPPGAGPEAIAERLAAALRTRPLRLRRRVLDEYSWPVVLRRTEEVLARA